MLSCAFVLFPCISFLPFFYSFCTITIIYINIYNIHLANCVKLVNSRAEVLSVTVSQIKKYNSKMVKTLPSTSDSAEKDTDEALI